MRYIIYGAGAIGCTAGARLFEHGREVVLIARGAHLQELQQHGLTFRSPEGEQRFKIPAVGRPSAIAFRDDDMVLLTMKTQDTEAALTDLEAAAGNDVPVFCVQNGVENERIAARRFARVYGVYLSMSATYLEPGIVEADAAPIAGFLDPGCFPSGVDGTAVAVAADLEASKLSSRAKPDIMRWKYTKLLGNLNNGLQIICGMDADTRAIRRAVAEEAIAVFRAAGIDYASREEMAQRRAGVASVSGGGRQGNSTWQSVARGLTAVEADFLNGEIVSLGHIHGIPTPLNEAVRRLANQVARERKPPGSVVPEEVRRLAAALSQE